MGKLEVGKQRIAFVVLFTCLLAMVTSIERSTAAPPPGDTKVTSTIADAINGVPTQIQNDDQGSYTSSKSVKSVVQGIGDWELDTNYSSSSTRAVQLDFTKPIAGSGPNGGSPIAPFATGLAKVRFISKCSLYGFKYPTIPTGSTVSCPLTTGFDHGGNRYRLQMNPVAGTDVDPETDYVSVTCNAASGGSCINWTIEPPIGSKGGYTGPNGDVRQNIARLSKMVTSKGKTVPVNQGNFLIAFSIGVTNP